MLWLWQYLEFCHWKAIFEQYQSRFSQPDRLGARIQQTCECCTDELVEFDWRWQTNATKWCTRPFIIVSIISIQYAALTMERWRSIIDVMFRRQQLHTDTNIVGVWILFNGIFFDVPMAATERFWWLKEVKSWIELHLRADHLRFIFYMSSSDVRKGAI